MWWWFDPLKMLYKSIKMYEEKLFNLRYMKYDEKKKCSVFIVASTRNILCIKQSQQNKEKKSLLMERRWCWWWKDIKWVGWNDGHYVKILHIQHNRYFECSFIQIIIVISWIVNINEDKIFIYLYSNIILVVHLIE